LRDADDNITYRDRQLVNRFTAFRGLLGAQRVATHEHAEIQLVVGAYSSVEVSLHSETGRRSEGRMRPGEIAIIRSGQPHSFAWRRAEMVSSVYIDPVHYEEMRDALEAPRSSGPRQSFSLVDPLLRELIVSIAGEAKAGFPRGRAFADAAETCLLARAFQHLPSRSCADLRARPISKPIERAIDYIEAHFTEDVGVDDLAAVAGLNRFHLAHAFKAATGRSPYRFLLERRVLEAKRLLMTDLPLVVLALTLGFADQSHFAKRFRAITGVSPGNYRKNSSYKAQ